MPKACSDCFAERCIGSDFGCDILGFDDANTTCFTKKRRKDCPLIEIQSHGRLIDADAIPWIKGKDEQDKPIYLLLKFQVEELPTIIESECE